MSERPVILIPVDFSAPSRRAAAWGFDYAQRFSGEVHLVHIVERQWRLADLRVNGDGVKEELETSFHGAESELSSLAASAQERIGTVREHVCSGKPGAEIVRLAGELHADMIVMGTHGHTGLGRVFIGSVAESVVRKAPCTVVTVKAK